MGRVASSIPAARAGGRRGVRAAQGPGRELRLQPQRGPQVGGKSARSHGTRGRESLRERALRLLRTEISFVPNVEFPRTRIEEWTRLDPPAANFAMSSLDVPTRSPSIARLCEVGVLPADRTRELFRQMNLLKYLANSSRSTLDPDRVEGGELDRIEQALSAARGIRDELIQANMRLVVHIARDFVTPRFTLEEALSEGITALMTAVEKFDFDRGFQFTTYAYRIIARSIARRLDPRRQRASHYVTLDDTQGNEIEDYRSVGIATERGYDQTMSLLLKHFPKLDRRERFIVRCRYALGKHRRPKSCQRLADVLGISKERVRQLELRAIEKLRRWTAGTRT